MAKNVLPVDFQDDILSEDMNGRRKYQIITNADGTVSFVDVTEYTQVGSNFGQAQINATNAAVNESADKNKIIDDKDDLVANSQAGMIAGALAVKAIRDELNNKTNFPIQTKNFSSVTLAAANTFEKVEEISNLPKGKYIATVRVQQNVSSAATDITSWVSLTYNNIAPSAGQGNSITLPGGTQYPVGTIIRFIELSENGSISVHIRSNKIDYVFGGVLQIIKIT